MSKWKNIKTYMEVNPYTGQSIDEDMPTNAAGRGAVAGIGVGPDGEPGINLRKKKKRTLIDARSKSYKQHREKLEKARAKREEKKSRLAQKVTENTDDFSKFNDLNEVKVSSYITGELRDIVKNKSAKNIKFKDGSMLVDMTTASMMMQVLDKLKSATKRKVMSVLDSGKKSDFLKFHGLVMKAVR